MEGDCFGVRLSAFGDDGTEYMGIRRAGCNLIYNVDIDL